MPINSMYWIVKIVKEKKKTTKVERKNIMNWIAKFKSSIVYLTFYYECVFEY